MNKNDLYNIFLKCSYQELIDLFKQSKNKEEQDFYMSLANIVLQREQKKVIGENIYNICRCKWCW